MTPPSASPERIRLSGGAIEIAGLDYGGESDRSLVLLHGIRDLAWSLDPLARALAPDWRVLAPDLRGHGDSAKPGAYTFPHYAADLRSLVGELGLERVALVGHSLGGQVAAHYASLFPEQVSACVLVEGLGPPLREGEAGAEGRRHMARARVEELTQATSSRRRLADLDEAFERVRRNHPRLDLERARFLAEEGTEAHPAGGLRWKWDPGVQDTWSSWTRDQTEERWSWIECPVLVVTGATSGAWWQQRRSTSAAEPSRASLAHSELERRLACFKDVRHVEIADAGHMIHFDQPDSLNDVVARFLEGAR